MRINKKNIFFNFLFWGMTLNVQLVNAEYIAKFPLDGMGYASVLEDYPPLYGDWYNVGSTKNCTTWSPATNTIKQGNNFTQTATCDQSQERTVQQRQKDKTSNAIVNKGTPTKETQEIKTNTSQNALGTRQVVKVCVPVGATWTQGYWLVGTNGTVSIVYYGPSIQESATQTVSVYGLPVGTTSYIKGEYTYTRGSFSHNSNGAYYQVCREG